MEWALGSKLGLVRSAHRCLPSRYMRHSSPGAHHSAFSDYKPGTLTITNSKRDVSIWFLWILLFYVLIHKHYYHLLQQHLTSSSSIILKPLALLPEAAIHVKYCCLVEHFWKTKVLIHTPFPVVICMKNRMSARPHFDVDVQKVRYVVGSREASSGDASSDCQIVLRCEQGQRNVFRSCSSALTGSSRYEFVAASSVS